MPFIEQQARYDGLFGEEGIDTNNNRATVRGRYMAPNTGNIPEALGTISSFGCPSDGNASRGFNPEGQGHRGIGLLRSSYIGCVGDRGHGTSNDNVSGVAHGGAVSGTNGRPSRGAFVGQWSDHLRTTRGINEITDGTSNTLLLSETQVSMTHFDHTAFGNFAVNLGVGALIATPANCLNAVEADKRTIKDAHRATSGEASRGHTLRLTTSVGFNACLPPNSPSCSGMPATNSATMWLSTSSFHTGGVNVLLTDGSGRFAPDTVNVGENLNVAESQSSSRDAIQSGASRFGVWGNLGAINSDQSVSL